MSLLPKDTFVNSGRSLYAAAGSGGGGGGNTLQSPASVTPDVNGNISLSMLTPDGNSQLTVRTQGVNDTASLFVKSDNGNAVLTIDASGGGGASLIMNGSDGQAFVTMNQSSATPSVFSMFAAPAQVGQSAFLTYDPSAGTLALGDGLGGGVAVRNGLQVRDEAVVPDPTAGINLTMTAPLTGEIAKSSATGSLSLGSVSSNPNIIQLTQTSASPDT
jgi:hypothetical protein